MEVLYCTPAHRDAWENYVQRSEAATFYLRFDWKSINEKCFGHETFYLAAVEGGDVRGVFPLVLLRSRIFGRILCSMPFVNLGGPCADDGDAMAALMAEASTVLKRTRAKYLEVRSPVPLNTLHPPSMHKISLTVALAGDPETIWRGFSPKHRKNIRRATNHGFRTNIGGVELLDDFYSVLANSWRDLGTPLYAKSYFREVLDAFPDTTRVFVVRKEGELAGATMCGHHRGIVEGLWAGTASRHRGGDSNYVLYWDMIKHYCEAGFERFHLGRSTVDSGAEAFKRKWLAEAAQLYWHHIPGSQRDVPQLNKENPKFRLAIEAWRLLPLAVTRRIGPVISRGIP